VVVAACFVVAMGWLALSVGWANTLRNIRPAAVLAFVPFDAGSKVALAGQLLANPDDRLGASRARELVVDALQRDPSQVGAWRTLSLLAAIRSDPKAARLFHLTERMSRRDLPTQLWLIEERVSANDVRGALAHYDIALRSSPQALDILLPVMVGAISSDSIVGPLGDLLATNPPWRRALYIHMASDASAADHEALLLERLAAAGPLTDRDILGNLVTRMTTDGKVTAAWRVYRLIRPVAPEERLVRNPDFSRAGGFPPFDWHLSNNDDLSADAVTLPEAGRGPVLRLQASSGNGGIAAQQLLLLPAGSYRLVMQAGLVSDSPPALLSMQLTCVNQANAAIGSAELTPSATARVSAPLVFHVPVSDCPAQWLSIGVRPAASGGDGAAWIDAVSLQPITNSSTTRG
jgi:hypothetical protein